MVYVLCFPGDLFSQEIIPELVTDRPDITESPNVIHPGWLQIESGFSIKNLEFTSEVFLNKVRTYNIAGTLFRIGLLKAIELRIGGGYQIKETESATHNSELTGISDVLVGSKIALVQANKSIPDLAVLVQFYLPFGPREFRSEAVEPEIIVAGSNDFTESFSLSYNIGGRWNFKDESQVYVLSVAGGFSIVGNINGFIEGAMRSLNKGGPEYTIDGGFTYLLQRNLQIDLAGGTDIPTSGSTWFIKTGISFQLPK
jgi:hypothetical protein